MLKPTPFHERTTALCESWKYKDWAGKVAVCTYDGHSEREYYAVRHAAGLMDASPLYKYDVFGADGAKLLSRVATRDVSRDFGVGRVTYCTWCDENGNVLDDGTISHLAPGHFRVTSSEPWQRWLERHGRRLDVRVEETTDALGCLALQGPNARAILDQCVDFDMSKMRFFRVRRTKLDGVDVWISRTGYTGDLGFEVWVAAADALRVWDALMAAGRLHGITPMGLDALDVLRIEAGYVLQGVDYFSAKSCIIEARKSTPHELGLGGAVDLERDIRFVGQEAVEAELTRGHTWALVGLDVSWPELEALYEEYSLPPHLAPAACRDAVPVFEADGRTQVGQATSHTWSPLLKKQLSLASVAPRYAVPGTKLKIEHTVEYERRTITATVVDRPFFDPERKRATPGRA
ncbi:MAG: aminomethyltransferase family protein [Myxococcota bacterium]